MFYRLFYPRQTCMFCASHEGKNNVTVADWVMPASVKPPMVAVSLNGKSYSLELAAQSKCFTLCILPESMKEKAAGAGSATGRVIDKVEEYGLKLKKAKAVKAPLLEGALAWVECEVVAVFDAGDHAVVLGEVVETRFPDEEAGRTPMLFNWGNKNYFGMLREGERGDTRLAVVRKEEKADGRKEKEKEKAEQSPKENKERAESPKEKEPAAKEKTEEARKESLAAKEKEKESPAKEEKKEDRKS